MLTREWDKEITCWREEMYGTIICIMIERSNNTERVTHHYCTIADSQLRPASHSVRNLQHLISNFDSTKTFSWYLPFEQWTGWVLAFYICLFYLIQFNVSFHSQNVRFLFQFPNSFYSHFELFVKQLHFCLLASSHMIIKMIVICSSNLFHLLVGKQSYLVLFVCPHVCLPLFLFIPYVCPPPLNSCPI